jgi:hypothetical protein
VSRASLWPYAQSARANAVGFARYRAAAKTMVKEALHHAPTGPTDAQARRTRSQAQSVQARRAPQAKIEPRRRSAV